MIALFASNEQFELGKKSEQTPPTMYKNCYFREISKNFQQIHVLKLLQEENKTMYMVTVVSNGHDCLKTRCTCQDSILAPWCRHIVGLLLYFAKHRNKGIVIATENNRMPLETSSTSKEKFH